MESPDKKDYTKERRRFPRLNTTVAFDFSVIGKQSALKEKSYVKNIGEGGFCITVYERIGLDDILNFTINMPEGRSQIHAKGRVIWTAEYVLSGGRGYRWEVGIEFTEISETDRHKIAWYVSTFLR